MVKWVEMADAAPPMNRPVLVQSALDGFGLAHLHSDRLCWIYKVVNGATRITDAVRWTDVIPDVMWCDPASLRDTLPSGEECEG